MNSVDFTILAGKYKFGGKISKFLNMTENRSNLTVGKTDGISVIFIGLNFTDILKMTPTKATVSFPSHLA